MTPFSSDGNAVALAVSMVGWLATQGGLAWRYSSLRRRGGPVAKRNWVSLVVFLAQSATLFLLFAPPWRIAPFVWEAQTKIEIAIVALLTVCGVASFFGGLLALGGNFAANAQVREDGALVTTGAYGVVRNPIYFGYLLLFVASGLALGDLRRLAIAGGLFLVLTAARILAEERVLKDHYGRRYDDYAARVKRLIPFVW